MKLTMKHQVSISLFFASIIRQCGAVSAKVIVEAFRLFRQNWCRIRPISHFLVLASCFLLLAPCPSLLLLTSSSSAQTLQDTDTMRTYKGNEVVITATRAEISLHDSPSSIEILTEQKIRQCNGTNLADALAGSAGLFLKDYGGTGGLKTISMRGLGAEHTLVLVNGNRYNNFQNGLVDLSMLLTDNVERIEIVRGGNSALYGADALGGVINIITKLPDGGPTLGVEGAVGSFGYTQYRINLGNSFGKWVISGKYTAERSDGTFSYISDNVVVGEERERTNADFSLQNLVVDVQTEMSSAARAGFLVQYTVSERGVPGAVVGTDYSKARQQDRDLNVIINYQTQIAQRIRLRVSPNFHYSYQRYLDPTTATASSGVDSYYRNTAADFNGQIDYAVSDQVLFLLGGELGRAALRSNEVSDVVRTQKSFFLSSQLLFDTRGGWIKRISLYPTLRYDSFSDRSDGSVTYEEWSPKIGANLRLLDELDLQLRSSLGRNFRIPTFNDLYWQQGGNPNLKPEHSLSFDFGFVFGLDFMGKENLEVTYFNIDTQDRIIWLPTSSPLVWSPQNIGRVKSTGVETSFKWSGFDDLIDLQIHHSITNALNKSGDDKTCDKQIIYVPKETASIGISMNFSIISLNVLHTFVSHRFTTADNDPNNFLPSYQITSGNVIASFPLARFKVTTKLEVNNIFNTNYQVLASYPMPLSNYRFVLGMDY